LPASATATKPVLDFVRAQATVEITAECGNYEAYSDGRVEV